MSPWRIVAVQEGRSLWLGGRGLLLLVGFSVLLSVVTYFAGTNTALSFLEQREAVNLALQVAVAVGVLISLVVSADAVSGERERGSLESLLLAPVKRRSLLLGKLAAALSVWFAAFVVSIPYLVVLGHGVGVVGQALGLGLGVGTLLAVGLVVPGLLISAVSPSNKTSLAISLFLLLATFAPTQISGGLPQGWFGVLIERLNPVGATLHYFSSVLVSGRGWTRELDYLVSPLLTVVISGALLVLASERLVTLRGGRNGG